jgi:hypothetical protein
LMDMAASCFRAECSVVLFEGLGVTPSFGALPYVSGVSVGG